MRSTPAVQTPVSRAWSALTKVRTVLPVSAKYNPVLSSTWPTIAGLFAGLLVVYLWLVFIVYPASTARHLKPMASFQIPSPHFREGTLVEMREAQAAAKGTIVDARWTNGHWLYEVRLSPMQVQWVPEQSLIEVSALTITTNPDEGELSLAK
jgi:hypothetical protein